MVEKTRERIHKQYKTFIYQINKKMTILLPAGFDKKWTFTVRSVVHRYDHQDLFLFWQKWKRFQIWQAILIENARILCMERYETKRTWDQTNRITSMKLMKTFVWKERNYLNLRYMFWNQSLSTILLQRVKDEHYMSLKDIKHSNSNPQYVNEW